MTAKKKRKKNSVWIRILLVLNFLFILLLLLSCTASYVSPGQYWIFAFLGIAFPVIAGINIFFLVLWIILWRKYAWITMVAITVGLIHFSGLIPLRFHSRPAPDRETMKVLTFNINNFYGISPFGHQKGLKAEITEFLAKEKPDICCIQEFFLYTKDTSKGMDRFAEAFGANHFIYRNYYIQSDPQRISAIAIFTKYPILETGSFRLKDKNVFAIFADLNIGDKIVRVYNLHLESIRFGQEDYSFYQHLTEANSDKLSFSTGSLKIVSKLKKAFILRSEQVDIIEKSFATSPYPLVVCGDFNDTPTSYTYHKLTGSLTDAFREAGSGIFGSTYSGSFPSFRIDYILYSPFFEGFDYKKYDLELSDHSPVSVRMRVAQ